MTAGSVAVPAVDPVRLAVITNRMESIVRAMSNTLFRTARSGVINTGRDFSACIVTREDELLAAAESLPIHVLSGPDLVARYMKRVHPDLRAGDAFLHNSPYEGNSHAADHCLVAPVVDAEGEHHFTVLVKAHLADAGNSRPTSMMMRARDVYQEGALIFPCVKVQEDYEHVEDVLRMCRARIRVPEMWWGDYLAMLGAVRVAERELLALGDELGWDALHRYTRDWFDYSERRMESAIRRLPSGTRTACTAHDPMPVAGAEHGVPIAATVTVDAEAARIEVDLRDNGDCVAAGINTTEATARTAAMIGVLNSLGSEVPVNGGSFRRLQVDLRVNCVAGIPLHPFSCSVATTGIPERIAGAVQLALSQLGPDIGMAEAGGMLPASTSVVSGGDPRRGGAPFIDFLCFGITGGPGHPRGDAWLNFAGGCLGMNARDSVEVAELLHPLRIECNRIVPDTEGAGRHRGAPSNQVEYTPVGATLEFIWSGEGTTNPAAGARGGGAGARGAQRKRGPDGAEVELDAFESTTLAPGETLVSFSAGGGGYGRSTERDPEAVRKDVREGYVSRARAAEVYGVVLDAAGAIDPAATASRRADLLQAAAAADGFAGSPVR
ncbi:MAG: hydantoinase B/oxoprolinase family protein [Actinobacteria bacterium]|nr:hydantoinase B/oxoprolinase family protein [Actinomycetota bacterium]